MISTDKRLKKFCKNYHLVENYMQARFDVTQIWHLHHRREISEMKSAKQLIEEGKYYDLEPEELIFLTNSEHSRLHDLNKREETKKKISNSNKGENNYWYGKGEMLKGENNPMFGRKHTEESKRKNSISHRKENLSDETRRKMSENNYCKKHGMPFDQRKKVSESCLKRFAEIKEAYYKLKERGSNIKWNEFQRIYKNNKIKNDK